MFGTRSAGTTYDDHDSPPKRQPPRAAAQPSAARGPGRDRGCDVHVDRRLHYAEQVLRPSDSSLIACCTNAPIVNIAWDVRSSTPMRVSSANQMDAAVTSATRTLPGHGNERDNDTAE